jgi:hypothetical protein
MSEARYYSNIKEIQVVHTKEAVNKLLAEGWEFLKPYEVMQGKDGVLQHTFLLGRSGNSTSKSAPSQGESKPDRKCFKCGEPVKIESQGKGKGYRILNPDDSAHRCSS